jgi:transposase
MQTNKGGAPTKYSTATAKLICDALEVGVSRRDAASYAGISSATFYRWMASDRQGFRDAVARATARFKVHMSAIVCKAAKEGDWRAALAALERHDRIFGPKTDEEKTNTSDAEDLTEKEIRARIAELLGKK